MTGGTGRRGWSFGWELVKMKDGEEGDGEGRVGFARRARRVADANSASGFAGWDGMARMGLMI
jgi:hypothetical protein